jgi:hypothetical protein
MILNRVIVLIGIVFVATACNKLKGPEKPKNLISKNKMVNILIDAKLITSSSSKNKLIMRDSSLNLDTYIYEKYNIDSLQFALSNNYYAFHIEDYEEIYTKTTDSLEKLKAVLKEQEAKEWKEQTKREADSLEKVLKEKQRLKSLDKDSLGLNILKDSIKIDEAFLEESIEELEDLVEPISDN